MTGTGTTLAELAALVDEAAQRLNGVADVTPLQRNTRLSELTGANIWLKREDLQPVRSYKLRGAYNLMSQLNEDEAKSGVVCASAGNHGQGVAWSCARLGIQGRIYIPSTTPRQKRDRMKALGGQWIDLIVGGETYDDAAAMAAADVEASGATVVHAFNDIRTAAGQGTVAKEVVEALGKAPDVFLTPVGGGGMLAGCSAWLRTHHPHTRIIGVEPSGAPSMAEAMRMGHPAPVQDLDTFVDGAAVRQVGNVTHHIARQAAPELVTSPEGQVCTEMLAMYQTDGIIAEPAGALAASALRPSPHGNRMYLAPDSTVVAIVSGGNNDVSRYNEIVERSLVYEGRKHYFLVSFPQEPGALRRFLDEVLGPDDDITHFEYVKRSNREVGPALVGIELGDPGDYSTLLQRMTESPIQVEIIDPQSPLYRFLI